MDLKELTDLIAVRSYVVMAISLSAIERKMVNELSSMLLLLDNKILSILTGPDFKEYIDFKNVRQAKEEAARITNLPYSAIKGRK